MGWATNGAPQIDLTYSEAKALAKVAVPPRPCG